MMIKKKKTRGVLPLKREAAGLKGKKGPETLPAQLELTKEGPSGSPEGSSRKGRNAQAINPGLTG